ncbi:hypothetical protein ABZ807_02155 [Micromonospora sp. NPDC047548]
MCPTRSWPGSTAATASSAAPAPKLAVRQWLQPPAAEPDAEDGGG